LQEAAGGRGNASYLGEFRYVMQVTVDLGTAAGLGTFVLSFSNGDVIFGTFKGQGDVPPPPLDMPAHITETLTINGGTGRFEGASGTLTFNRTVELHFDGTPPMPVYDSQSGTLTGTIKLPSK